ncbi:hypothetical protein GGS20DRAFT_583010 [Poronia punctata]|nr:hypothetical protein GGS20DRAFT_583010 [Poronia punctata]
MPKSEKGKHAGPYAELGDKTKKKKKRIVTSARREQNRVAQRAYRERQRERKKLQKPILPRPRGLLKLAPRVDDRDGSFSSATVGSIGVGSLEDVAPDIMFPQSKGNSTNCILDSDVSREGGALLSDEPPASLLSRVDASLEVSSFTAGLTVGGTGLYTSSCADLYLDTGTARSLEDNRTAVLRACLSNAICIGMDLSELMFCEKPYMSPFYRPTGTTIPSPASDENYSSYDFLPLSLRPTWAQILIAHHASLDLIPLPKLRERAILASAALPHLLSPWEMKLDIYTRDALLCQVSGVVAYQSWDRSSWQVETWFLDKWKMVVDGDDFRNREDLFSQGIPGLWM